jgi:hypothetical protein
MYAGIDPGKSGAIAVLESSGRLLHVSDMPPLKIGTRTFVDGKQVSELLEGCTHVCVELVSSRPGHAITQNLQLPTPQAWQKHFGLKKIKGEKSLSKETIAAKCLELYPDALLYGPRGGLKDGRSDAILIARFCLDTMAYITEAA